MMWFLIRSDSSSNEYPQFTFLWIYKKNINTFLLNPPPPPPQKLKIHLELGIPPLLSPVLQPLQITRDS